MPQESLKPDAVFRGIDPDSWLGRIDKMTWLLDQSIRIPGTRFRFGLDPLLGLLPIGGDLASGAVQAWLIALAVGHYRVPKVVAARMVANTLLDFGVGAIPIVGDVWDFTFKSSTRNLRLLNEVRAISEAGRAIPTAPSRWYLIGLAAAFFGVLALIVAFGVFLGLWFFSLLRGLWTGGAG